MPPAPDTLRLELELHSREDPIQGHIGAPHGRPIPFTGWLELMAAMQRLSRESPSPAHEAPTGEDDVRSP